MATLLRQIVSGPRARHPEAGLDLCYVTDYIVVTSGPSSEWLKKAYRNPVDQLVAFLDRKHGRDWCIFEFRAEGTGYADAEVYGRIRHFPWPDHHPPPFAVVPGLMAAMRDWIKPVGQDATAAAAAAAETAAAATAAAAAGDDAAAAADTPPQQSPRRRRRVAVVHCKAGKGRSGTVSTSYLISEEGWKREDALDRFTSRRMRAGFGQGVSIPSQLRYVGYVDRWANQLGKKYTERAVEIVEVHIWGLCDGVKVCVEGYVDGGKTIKHLHTFTRDEKTVIDAGDSANEPRVEPSGSRVNSLSPSATSSNNNNNNNGNANSTPVQTVILRPQSPLIVPGSDVNIDFERRNGAGYTGLTMVTSIAHVWFNAFFEGGCQGHDSGVFEIDWDAMDGIKGTKQKGFQALDRLKVVWRYADEAGREVEQPPQSQAVFEVAQASWEEGGAAAATIGPGSKQLGLRLATPESADISRAPSLKDLSSLDSGRPGVRSPAATAATDRATDTATAEEDEAEEEGVKTHIPQGDYAAADAAAADEERETRQDTKVGEFLEVGLAKVANIIARWKDPS